MILPSGTVNFTFLMDADEDDASDFASESPTEPTLTIRLVRPTKGLFEPFGPTVVLARTIAVRLADALPELAMLTACPPVETTFRAKEAVHLELSGDLTVSVALLMSTPLEPLNAVIRPMPEVLTPKIVKLEMELRLMIEVPIPPLSSKRILIPLVFETIRPPAMINVAPLLPPQTMLEFLSAEALDESSLLNRLLSALELEDEPEHVLIEIMVFPTPPNVPEVRALMPIPMPSARAAFPEPLTSLRIREPRPRQQIHLLIETLLFKSFVISVAMNIPFKLPFPPGLCDLGEPPLGLILPNLLLNRPPRPLLNTATDFSCPHSPIPTQLPLYKKLRTP